MPFTPAHPAILFPLKFFPKLKWSWTALLIGSIIPDFEYFIWLSPSAYVSHSWEGIILFNLPMTVLMAFMWHQVMAPVLLPKLHFIKSGLNMEHTPAFFPWLKSNWLMFLLSALTGILSHLVWDSFCHANGYMVHRIPYLLAFTDLGPYHIRNCYLLWYLSTLAGGVLMLAWLVDFSRVFRLSSWTIFFSGASFWGKILFAAGLIAIVRISLGLGWNWTRHLVMIFLGSLFYATLALCWLEKGAKKKAVLST
ncbi:MAG: DUF4184 family protein [Bacteroidia bacterium]|nr:DUF4184 family protein [Bacteroidia bacterium]